MEINGKRIPFLGEARHGTAKALGNKPMRFASGGRIHQNRPTTKYTAGAGSGMGRIQKEEAYGIEPKGRGK